MFDKNTSTLKGFQVIVSADGKRATGKKIPTETKTTEAASTTNTDEPRIIQVFDYADTGSRELLAQISENIAEEYRRKADIYVRMASEKNADRRYYMKRLEKAVKWRNFWKKTKATQVISFALAGFILGVILAVSQLLEKHGPTVTIFGTIGACAIYLAVGTLFGGFFGWLGKEQANDSINAVTEKIEVLKELIQESSSNHEELMSQAEKYTKLAREEQKRAWHYWGFC